MAYLPTYISMHRTRVELGLGGKYTTQGSANGEPAYTGDEIKTKVGSGL